MTERRPSFEIFAVSLGAILLEIAYTRVFSFKVFYYFTYLILGVGLLGMGSGGVLVALSRRVREAPLGALVSACCLAGAASALASYAVLAPLPLNATRLSASPFEVAKLAAACLVLVAPFLCAGIVVARILSSFAASAGRLYGADLAGAALGCLAVVPLLVAVGPAGTILLAGLVWAGVALRTAASAGVRVASAALALALAAGVAQPSWLPDPVTDDGKFLEGFRAAGTVRESHWHPVFRIDVADHPTEPGSLVALLHDGGFGSAIHRFDGDLSDRARLEQSSRALPFSVLPEGARVLVIGSAGGHEVLMSLLAGASRVVGVELHPVTLELLRGPYAEFSGGLHRHPRVELVNAEGRSYLSRTDERFDLIWFVAPDSYAAMNASSAAAFVLSESYLYTVEAIRQSLDHLAPGGVVAAQFGEFDYASKPNRTARWLATARAALAERGAGDFGKHVIVSSAGSVPPQSESTILLGEAAFSPAQVAAFRAALGRLPAGSLRHVPGDTDDDGPVSRVIGLPDEELAAWLAAHPYRLDPVRDDSPFFWHFARFRDALGLPGDLRGYVDFEDRIGEQVMLVFLALAAAVAALFLLAPLVALRGTWRGIPHKARTGLYFAGLGLGFMLLEVSGIQMLTLLLGYPTYSLSVTLCGFLVFSGIGAAASGRIAGDRGRALWAVWGALALATLAFAWLLPPLLERAAGAALPLRIALGLLSVAPLALCLGVFLPVGLGVVSGLSAHAREYAAWAWAMNGFFSVMGSVLSTVLAMAFGFRAVLLLALAVYALAVASLTSVPRPGRASGR